MVLLLMVLLLLALVGVVLLRMLLLLLLLPQWHSHDSDLDPAPGRHFQHPLGVRVGGSDCSARRKDLLPVSAEKTVLSTVTMAPTAAATTAAAAATVAVQLLLEPEVFLRMKTVAMGHASVLRCKSVR